MLENVSDEFLAELEENRLDLSPYTLRLLAKDLTRPLREFILEHVEMWEVNLNERDLAIRANEQNIQIIKNLQKKMWKDRKRA